MTPKHDTGVYLIVNLVNGKTYVGSASVSFKVRWKAHVKMLREKRHHNAHLQAAWNAYGEAAFEFRELLLCPPGQCVNEENRIIKELDAITTGYNFKKAVPTQRGGQTKSRLRKARASGNVPRQIKCIPPSIVNGLSFSDPVESWTFRNHQTGKVNKLVMFPSRRRANSFRVVVNGKEWTRGMGYDRIMRQTVKALTR